MNQLTMELEPHIVLTSVWLVHKK